MVLHTSFRHSTEQNKVTNKFYLKKNSPKTIHLPKGNKNLVLHHIRHRVIDFFSIKPIFKWMSFNQTWLNVKNSSIIFKTVLAYMDYLLLIMIGNAIWLAWSWSQSGEKFHLWYSTNRLSLSINFLITRYDFPLHRAGFASYSTWKN